jgi:hypothetical protein
VFNKSYNDDKPNMGVRAFKCPNCGAPVEIFPDEMQFCCKKCGTLVVRKEAAELFRDWCPEDPSDRDEGENGEEE